MFTLYELTEGMRDLVSDPEIQEAIRDTLEAMEGEFRDKAVAIVKMTEGVEGDIEAIDNEIKRLQARKKTKQNFVERFRDYLRDNMELSGIKKIEHPLFSITLGKPSKVVEITGEVPENYQVVTTRPDKKKLLADLKDGADIPGAELVEGKSRLLIR